MGRFILDHRTREGIRAEYGFDPVLGFFVDVFIESREKPLISFDTWHPSFNTARPLLGCLDFLVEQGFFTGDDLEEALIAIADDLDVTSERVRRVVEVILEFKAAAD